MGEKVMSSSVLKVGSFGYQRIIDTLGWCSDYYDVVFENSEVDRLIFVGSQPPNVLRSMDL